MNKIRGYANYGCLSHEKVVVFTHSAPQDTATYFDEIEMTIPEDWKVEENDLGQIILTSPWGWTYKPDEVLAGKKNPCLHAMDKDQRVYNKSLVWEVK